MNYLDSWKKTGIAILITKIAVFIAALIFVFLKAGDLAHGKLLQMLAFVAPFSIGAWVVKSTARAIKEAKKAECDTGRTERKNSGKRTEYSSDTQDKTGYSSAKQERTYIGFRLGMDMYSPQNHVISKRLTAATVKKMAESAVLTSFIDERHAPEQRALLKKNKIWLPIKSTKVWLRPGDSLILIETFTSNINDPKSTVFHFTQYTCVKGMESRN